MPSLTDIGQVLREHSGRFEALDVFVDDVDELRDNEIASLGIVLRTEPTLILMVPVGASNLQVEVFQKQGIARFQRMDADAPVADNTVGATVVGAIIGAALGAATDTKEGLLGGLFLGLLVGSALGGTPPPTTEVGPERVLALSFEPETERWRVYSGPLLRWAKRTLDPSPTR